MNVKTTNRRRRSEAGVAMLIAIFVLLLIAVVGIALIVSSGTETALAGNYRSSTAVHYAALAGLEEARGRLLPKNPNYFNAFVAPPGTTLGTNEVRYITNPVNGQNVLADYPDTEYEKEFGPGALAGANVKTTPSVSTVAGIQGALYRWVRINAATERSLNLDVGNDNNDDFNTVNPVFYDGTRLTLNPTASQALEITSLAVLPNGTQKMQQYVVAPATLNLNFANPPSPNLTFPGALTLVGSAGQNVQFNGPGDPSFFVDGNDHGVGACPASATAIPAIAYANGSDSSKILNATPAGNYKGPGGSATAPSMAAVLLPSSLQKPDALEALVRTITENADVFLTPNPPLPPGTLQTFTQTDLPTSMMSPTNPLTIVVNGNLNLNSWDGTGYGLLVVRGTFNYDPTATWNGIVLVIGQGQYYSDQDGTGQINGAMLIAKTLDANGNLLTSFGAPSFTHKQANPPPSGSGIYYSSCWIKTVQTPIKYSLLSFREIPQ
jgi:hypothetical protein